MHFWSSLDNQTHGKHEIASQNTTVQWVSQASPLASVGKWVTTSHACSLLAAAQRWRRRRMQGSMALLKPVCPIHSWLQRWLSCQYFFFALCIQPKEVSNQLWSVTLKLTSFTQSLRIQPSQWLMFRSALRFAKSSCVIQMSKHSTCARRDVHIIYNLYLSCVTVLISALLCLCSVQISAVLSARSPSRGVGSRITC